MANSTFSIVGAHLGERVGYAALQSSLHESSNHET
jgi:hypothetical protein